ncbi:MAG: GIY-YIG nuclease family protein [Candidatus Liptonbacteria bacterium]|nr:GIY-YIG nuclease family protein [Candidatus Liptonbacteria bacterium]
MNLYVYILECADGTLYVGATKDLKKRVKQHNESKAGAHYTKIRRPVKLVYSEKFRTLGNARRREAAIKKLTRQEKLVLIKKT